MGAEPFHRLVHAYNASRTVRMQEVSVGKSGPWPQRAILKVFILFKRCPRKVIGKKTRLSGNESKKSAISFLAICRRESHEEDCVPRSSAHPLLVDPRLPFLRTEEQCAWLEVGNSSELKV